jgi:hypothetical protein
VVIAPILSVLAACGSGELAPPPLRLRATIAFPPKDTIALALSAEAHWCSDARSLLVASLSPEGSGAMIRVRYRDRLTSAAFPIVLPTDTGAVPAAVVGLRFFVGDTPHGYALDSGRVQVRRGADTIWLSGTGVGVENAIRIRASLESQAVVIGADSVACNYSP